MTQFDISVKSLIPSCQTLARTAPEFTECNSNSASMREKKNLIALIGHLAGCTCCKMDFPLNQQKQPSEIRRCAPALQIISKASVHMKQMRSCAQKQKKSAAWGEKAADIMHALSYWSCPTFSGEQMQCPRFLCSKALLCHTPTSWCKCYSHHNNTCICTIHRFHCSASQRETVSHTELHTYSCRKVYKYQTL